MMMMMMMMVVDKTQNGHMLCIIQRSITRHQEILPPCVAAIVIPSA